MTGWTREASVDLGIRLLSGELVHRNPIKVPGKERFYPPMSIDKGQERFPLSPIQMLAMAVLRDASDEATCAAFLDEVMESRKFPDEPVTEEWCVERGWASNNVQSQYQWSPGKCGELDVVLEFNIGEEPEMYLNDGLLRPVSKSPTVSEVVQLCRALGIPWSASDPLGK